MFASKKSFGRLLVIIVFYCFSAVPLRAANAASLLTALSDSCTKLVLLFGNVGPAVNQRTDTFRWNRPVPDLVVSSFPNAKDLLASTRLYRNLKEAINERSFDESILANRKRIDVTMGKGHWKVESATLPSGGNVFIKTVRIREGVNGERIRDSNGRRARKVLSEIFWADFFYVLGLGPKLYGISQDVKGRPVLVYEFIEGIHIKWHDSFPLNNVGIRDFAIEQLERLESLFLELGIAPGGFVHIRWNRGNSKLRCSHLLE